MNLATTLAFVAIATVAIVYLASDRRDASSRSDAGAIAPAFQLVTGDHQPFTRANLEGRWTFLFFGYTHCPDVCPVTLAEMTRVYQLLRQHPDAPQSLQVVFVSVDPARDTPDLLREFVQYFDPAFVAVTGPLEQLGALTAPLGVRHRRLTEQGDDYPVEHGTDVLLLDPHGRLRKKFPLPHRAEEIVAGFIEIVRQPEKTT
jgi:protein SCO1/2